MSVLVAADFDTPEWAAWWPLLRAALPDERLVRSSDASFDPAEVEVAIVANPAPGSLRDLPRLRLIQSLWAGIDRLLGDASVPVDVPLARMVDPGMGRAMAASVLWAVTALQRDFFRYAEQQREGRWQPHRYRAPEGFRVVVLGHGEMGGAASRALSAAGFAATAWHRGSETALAGAVACADVVVNLLPLTAATRGLFDAALLARLQRGASLVNFARGAHVVEADLLAALDDGHIGRAVLDVFATEPLPAGHPFWVHPRVHVLPHVAAPTDPRSAAAIAADNVRAWRAGQPLRFLVERGRGY